MKKSSGMWLFVVVFTGVLSGMGEKVWAQIIGVGSADVGGNISAGRHSGYGSIAGGFVDQISINLWTQGSSQPVAGDVGNFNVNFSLSGRYLENVSQAEIDFAIMHPRSSSGARRVTKVTAAGDFVFFDPALVLDYKVSTYLYQIRSGGSGGGGGVGKGEAISLVSPVTTWGGAFVNLDVIGGSIIDSHLWLETYEQPHPWWLPDWSANFSFSGVIEATSFSVGTVPEPATAALIGISTFFCRRRRQFV